MRVYDNAGNVYEDKVRIIIDVTPPSIQIISPQNLYINESEVTVRWEMNDNFGIYATQIRTDNSSWIAVNDSSYTFVGLKDGKHYVEIIVQDLAGNIAFASINFVVDTQPPIAYFLGL